VAIDNTANKLRINLARWNCFSLRITTEAVIEESLAFDLGIGRKRRFKTLYEGYTRSRIQHILALRFAGRDKESNQYGIRLTYETLEPEQFILRERPVETALKPSEAFSTLCKLEKALLVHCDCSFLYKRNDEHVTFLLPLKMDGEIYDEIRGIKFVKLQEDKILWENSVDLIDLDSMIHRVKFAQESKCSWDLPQELLRRARDISRKT
jgi:hypothetical protein